jgi:hypothetical protein
MRRLISGLSPWLEKCYCAASHLFFGCSVLESLVSLHQGDPLAMLLFALVLQPLALKIKAEVPELILNSWFADDGNLAGTPEDLFRAFQILVTNGPPRGLHLAPSKCLVWCGNEDPHCMDPLNCGIPRSFSDGLLVLGSPIGSPDFCNEILIDRIGKVKKALDKLPLLKNPQAQFVLLRSCLSFPKMSYNLRTVNPHHTANIFRDFDVAQQRSLENILSSSLSEEQWFQAALPVTMGGMGLCLAECHSSAAFCSSIS